MRSGLARWTLLLGLFLTICGAKFWLIDRFGNSTPISDEWDAEAAIIQSYREGSLSLARFIAPHAEHRIFFSRLFCLALFIANKQWDPSLMMIAQAPIHALAITIFIAMAGKFMSGPAQCAIAGLAALLTVLPLGWVNTLWAFQSPFYFMMLLGTAATWLCWRGDPFTPRWCAGALLAFASLFTLAGGVITAITLTIYFAIRMVFQPASREWKQLAALSILSGISVFGFLITPAQSIHTSLVATGFSAFLFSLTGILSWPCGSHWLCIIVQAPLILLSLLTILRRLPFTDGRWFVITLGAAYWLQAFATAYKRCKDWDSLRYCDSWIMLLLIICASLCLAPALIPVRYRSLLYPLTALWLAAVLGGSLHRGIDLAPAQITGKFAETLEMENNLRQYLRTGDAGWLKGKIPFPKAGVARLISVSRSLRDVLPSNLIDSSAPLAPTNLLPAQPSQTIPPALPPLPAPIFSTFSQAPAKPSVRISLQFKVPSGTRLVSLQVAGYPDAPSVSFESDQRHREPHPAALLNPGDYWQTIFIPLNPKIPFFRINAADASDRSWLAFSPPVVCPDHPPARWARSLAFSSLSIFIAGLVLLALAAIPLSKSVDTPLDAH